MKEKKLIILGILLIFVSVVFAYYLIKQERERHLVLQEAETSAEDLESTDLKQQSLGEQSVKLYFHRPGTFPSDSDYLVPEERVIYQISDRTLMAKQVLLELFRGPMQGMRARDDSTAGNPDSLGSVSRTVPSGTRLRQFFILSDGTAVVDLYGETVNNIEGVYYELLAIRSITRSLISNFEEIYRVRFLVEGKEQETLAGHVSISHPFRLE